MENKNSAEEQKNQQDETLEQPKEAKDTYEDTTEPNVDTKAPTESHTENIENTEVEPVELANDDEPIVLPEAEAIAVEEVMTEETPSQQTAPEEVMSEASTETNKEEANVSEDTIASSQTEDADNTLPDSDDKSVDIKENDNGDTMEIPFSNDPDGFVAEAEENEDMDTILPASALAFSDPEEDEETLTEPDEEPTEETPKKKQKKEKPKSGVGRKIFNAIVILFLVCTLIGSVTGFVILRSIVSKVSADGLAEKMVSKDSSIFLAADGKTIIGELGGEIRENITYDQVPQSTIDAFLAIEDSRFYKHNGFDLPRFISSAVNNLRSGDLSQGGSTLTMQTVDNFVMKPQEDALWEKKQQVFSTKEKIERKIQEIYLSMEVEKDLTKEEIMTKYLNEINFGQHTRGIQKGAQYYFGKNVEDLNLSESAFLAGVINAPNDNNPYLGYRLKDLGNDQKKKFNFYAAATKRRNDTLYQMLNHGYITETEYKLAKSTKLAFALNGEPESTINSEYRDYMMAASHEIYKKYGVDPATTPMVVYTALNPKAQKAANKVASGDVVGFSDNKYYQIGFTVIDNKTGEIIAICPGRSDIKSADGIEHYRFREPHQPGSSIKPIMDYAPSFDKIGYCTSRVYKDKAMSVGNWNVVNAGGGHYGKVSMERAIAQSLNTSAVQTFSALLDRVGYDEMIKYGTDMGFDANVMKSMDIQYAIGGSASQASPTEMAAAYATLANGGNYTEPHMVRQFVLKDEKKTVKAKLKKTQPLSPQAAYMTSELLYSAIFGKYNGWNLMSRLGFGAYPVYGKTGTSDWADEAWKYGGDMKDEWMINYTSEFTIATWSGFDKGIEGAGTYISTELLNMNIPGWINKYMLDTITTDNVRRIPNPGGISSYGGGMIKDEWLSTAAKNNPLTIANSKTDNKSLKSVLESAKALKSSDYTAATYDKLQKAIQAAEKMIKDDMSPQEDIDKAKAAIEEAIKGLESTARKDTLSNTISSASQLDTSRYTPESVSALQTAINNAKGVQNDKKATQAQVDAQVNAIKQAVSGLQEKPVPVDRSALQAAITNAGTINKDAYTPESVEAFNQVIVNATNVFNNANATQEQINEQVNLINKARNEVLKAR